MRNCSKLNIMNLSKTYDCLPHDLLTVKLAANSFDNTALVFITDDFTNDLQRVKIGATFSSYLKILRNVPIRTNMKTNVI